MWSLFCRCPWLYHYHFNVIGWSNLNNATAFSLWEYVSPNHFSSAWFQVCSGDTHIHTNHMWLMMENIQVSCSFFLPTNPSSPVSAVVIWACVEMELTIVGWVEMAFAQASRSLISLWRTSGSPGVCLSSFHQQPFDYFAVYIHLYLSVGWKWRGVKGDETLSMLSGNS